MRIIRLTLLFWLAFVQLAPAQQTYEVLLREMQRLERNVLDTYRNYLWLYYEEKQSAAELLTFEDLLGVYVKRLREAYETVALLGQGSVDEPRDIAARALIFRALTFLEKAPIDMTYFEKACYDYYDALILYEGTERVPVIFKRLPVSIQLGNKYYDRLIDLLDEKGSDLFQFGQVHIVLRNFKVTSPFDESTLELVRFSASDSSTYTYRMAERLLRQGFRAALQSNRAESVDLALPAGTYFIRSHKEARQDYINLATLYVRPNQYINYVVEPIADWVIFYETPGEFLAPAPPASAPKLLASTEAVPIRRDRAPGAEPAADSIAVPATKPHSAKTAAEAGFHSVDKIEGILRRLLDTWPADNIDELPITRSRDEFIESMAQIISTRVGGVYLTNWNQWTLAWNIAKSVTASFAPKTPVSLNTTRLAYEVLHQL